MVLWSIHPRLQWFTIRLVLLLLLKFGVFVGLASYYQCFVGVFFSYITSPLTKFTQNKISFKWCDTCKVSFKMLKDFLTLTPILTFPKEGIGFIFFCNASGVK